jgi:putative transposase
LLFVQADTVVSWQRERFRKFWARLSNPQRRRRGRPSTAAELRQLIEQRAAANPLWRASRIHGEFEMLGIAISERTVSRILCKLRRPPNQTWRTFLHNHIGQLISIHFFTVPTITMSVLFVWIVLEHDRRKVLHLNVTEHPTGTWTPQQIVEAFADRKAAQYLLRDRDSRYSAEVQLRIKSLGIEEILTAMQSPWQNPYAERFIGSIRRECLNHYIILNARHLKGSVASCVRRSGALALHEQEPAGTVQGRHFEAEIIILCSVVSPVRAQFPQLGRAHDGAQPHRRPRHNLALGAEIRSGVTSALSPGTAHGEPLAASG